MLFIKEITKNKNEIIRISIDEYKGEKLVNIRVFYRDKQNNLVPTKKGIAIRLELFPEVKKVLDEIDKIINDIQK